jgi:hypothetical protein
VSRRAVADPEASILDAGGQGRRGVGDDRAALAGGKCTARGLRRGGAWEQRPGREPDDPEEAAQPSLHEIRVLT